MKEYLIAFVSGSLSFFSPCVLPLIPGYFSLISGISAKEMLSGNLIERKKVFYFSLAFIVGFSMIFTLLGAFSSLAGSFIVKNRILFQKIMAVAMVIIGVHISGIFQFKILNFEKRKIYKSSRYGYITSLIVGMSFAFGWSPCIGPFLANILLIASTKSLSQGALLLFIYSLGLGLPFLIASFGVGEFFRFISSKRRLFIYLEKIAGILIIILGVLIFLDRFSIE